MAVYILLTIQHGPQIFFKQYFLQQSPFLHILFPATELHIWALWKVWCFPAPTLPYDPYCHGWDLPYSLSWVVKLRILPVLAIYTSFTVSEGSPTLGLTEYSSGGGPTFQTRDVALIFVSDENLLKTALYFPNYLVKLFHTKAKR